MCGFHFCGAARTVECSYAVSHISVEWIPVSDIVIKFHDDGGRDGF